MPPPTPPPLPAGGFEVADPGEADLSDTPVPEVGMPDLDGAGADMPEMAGPDIDVPEVDLPEVDLPEVDLPEVDVPEAGIPDLEIPDLGLPELDPANGLEIPDLDLEEAVAEGAGDVLAAPDLTDFAEDQMEQLEAPPGSTDPSTRSRYSPLLAATGIFGSGTPDSDEDSETDPDELADSEAEPAAGELDADAFVLGSTEPPSVYSELEDIAGEPEHEADQGVDEEETIDELAEVLGGSFTGLDDFQIDEDASSDETDEGSVPEAEHEGAGESTDDSPEIEAQGEEPELYEGGDPDFAALAAMVADVEPVVLGADTEVDPLEDLASTDTDDWLNDADESDDEGGFDIGITWGSNVDTPEVGDEHPEQDSADEDVAEQPEPEAHHAETDVVGMDVSDLDVPETDVSAMDLSGDALAEFGAHDVEIPDLDAPAEESLDLVDSDAEASGPDEPETVDPGSYPDEEARSPEGVAAVAGAASAATVGVFDELGDVSAGSMLSGEGEAWGSRWKEAAQGWVEDDSGASTWRPIITTSPTLSEWDVDTYLGVVIGDTATDSDSITPADVAAAREESTRHMVDEALARGAHAVVGVTHTVQPIGQTILVTVTGTAVTLKAESSG